MNWHLAVAEIANEKQASFRHNKEEGFTEWSNGSPPTEKEIQAKIKELQADYDSKKYQRDRLAEYPSIQELVVALYDADDKAEIDKKRAEIKKKYPKP